ncbi:MAG: PilZ domain-containing protein [Myxococcota bacterium]|nr:PilZ domain-containing protein [Myxococcota bacterium]
MGDDPAHFRRTAREPVELTVRFRRDAEDAALEHGGRLVDLGMGGAQVRCELPPGEGERVRLTLSAPSAWDPLDLPATVRWVEGATFGVAFGDLSRAQASALYELLAASRFAEASA